jgi:hypothetical protein
MGAPTLVVATWAAPALLAAIWAVPTSVAAVGMEATSLVGTGGEAGMVAVVTLPGMVAIVLGMATLWPQSQSLR